MAFKRGSLTLGELLCVTSQPLVCFLLGPEESGLVAGSREPWPVQTSPGYTRCLRPSSHAVLGRCDCTDVTSRNMKLARAVFLLGIRDLPAPKGGH